MLYNQNKLSNPVMLFQLFEVFVVQAENFLNMLRLRISLFLIQLHFLLFLCQLVLYIPEKNKIFFYLEPRLD